MQRNKEIKGDRMSYKTFLIVLCLGGLLGCHHGPSTEEKARMDAMWEEMRK